MEIKTKGSLCSGYGGLDMALPGELAWVAEKDEQAARVLKREHPDVPNLGDITTSPERFGHVDLLTSGDPCQSMSIASIHRRMSEDERFLWPDVMRIIDHVRPRVVFLENVQNVVNAPLIKGGEKGGVLKLRLDNLREAGYAARWTVLGACAVGAPHHRHRWFLYAERVGGTPTAERLITKCGAPRSGGRALLPSPAARDGSGRGEGTPEFWANRWATRPDRVGKGIPLGAVLNLLLPTPRTTDGTNGTNGGPNQRSSRGDLAMSSAAQERHWGKFTDAVRLWEEITGRPVPTPTELTPSGGQRLNAALSEWMMGLPAGLITNDMERNDALRLAGNGVVSLQAAAAWEMLAPRFLRRGDQL